jgi:hypothetical protein
MAFKSEKFLLFVHHSVGGNEVSIGTYNLSSD